VRTAQAFSLPTVSRPASRRRGCVTVLARPCSVVSGYLHWPAICTGRSCSASSGHSSPSRSCFHRSQPHGHQARVLCPSKLARASSRRAARPLL